MAQLRRLEQQFPDELVVIGVHSAKFPSEHLTENIRQAAQRLGIDHPVVNDTGFMIWNAYAVRAWPTLVLIGPNGRIADTTSGEILAEDYSRKIMDILQQNPDSLNRAPLDLAAGAPEQTDTLLRYPAKLLLAPANTLFIADTGHHRILQATVNLDSTRAEISAVYGSGQLGLRDGSAAEAQFNHPHGMALRGGINDGTLYVADTENHAVRAIDLSSGQVCTVAGTGEKAHGRFALGAPTTVSLRSPWALVSLDQYLFIAMAGSHQIWVLIDEKQIGPFAGTGAEALVDGPLNQAAFNQPSDLALGLGHLFVADPEASAVRAVSLDENPQVITLVGQGLFEFGDKDGVGGEVRLQHAAALAVDGDLVYIADTYNHKVKLLDPTTGEVNTLAGSGETGSQDGTFGKASFYEPEGLQAANGRIYIADTNNHAVRVADLDTRTVSTLLLYFQAGMSPQSKRLERLEPAYLAPGRARVILEPHLPPGTKRNPEGETSLSVGGEPPAVYHFAPDQGLAFEIEVREDLELPLGVALLYCESGDNALCRIDNRDLLLPVIVQPGGPAEVRVSYPVSPPAFA